MPCINEIIERVGRVRPDALDDGTKSGWLIELDGKLYRDVILKHVPLSGEVMPVPPRSFPEDAAKPLIVPVPFDILYDLYLMSQIDFCNREMDNYNNSALAFNTALDDYKRDYHRTHLPIQTGGFQNLF
ncbi:MAG: hypothetical protein RR336_05715 [Oscillospiraceae bacterium]